MVVDGAPSKVIAMEVGTSQKTVENQRSSILRKLKAGCVANLVRMVMIAGRDAIAEPV